MQYLTMYENIIAPLSLQKKKVIEMKKKAIELAKLLNIEHTLDKFPNECSGGEKQRAAIARALITNPKLIVADEPTGNLDEDTAQDIAEILKESAHKTNKCVVVVTHSNELAKQADIVLRLMRGKLQMEQLY